MAQLLASYPVEGDPVEYEYVLPIGAVLPWPSATDPSFSSLDEEWHECDGTTLSADDYPEITAVLGTSTLPDYRGLFLRGRGYVIHQQVNGTDGTNSQSTLHLSGDIGAVQGDATRLEYGIYPGGAASGTAFTNYFSGVFDAGGTVNSFAGVGSNYLSSGCAGVVYNNGLQVPTANEIRPVNTSVRYMIRIK